MSVTTLPAMTEQPHPNRVRLLPWSISPWLIDGLLIGLLLIGATLRSLVEDDADLAFGLAIVAIAGPLLVLRRSHPLPVLVVTVVAALVLAVAAGEPNLLMPAALVVLYTVATEFPWRIALAAGGATVAAFIAVLLVYLEPGRLDGGLLAAMAWPALATAAGSAVRAGRENLAQTQERVRRAEATRELEAERRVVEERLRIARDVHDLVAHHLAVVNVQSGVAAHVLRSDPDAAGTALEAVRTSASTAVAELGELLGVLRDPGDTDAAGSVRPTPDLDAIDDLISSFSASGLVVEHRVTGAPRPLSPTAQVAAYRVVQEALTNAHKHGDGRAVLAQTFDDEAMTIEVSNRIPVDGGPDVGPSGYGLIGMRERVEAAGGQLTVDAGRERFTVVAALPAREAT